MTCPHGSMEVWHKPKAESVKVFLCDGVEQQVLRELFITQLQQHTREDALQLHRHYLL